MLSKIEFKKELEKTLQANITLDHPFFSELFGKESEPNWPLLRLTALQGYQLTKHFLDYVETLFYFCPAGKHKRRLLFNLFEEETGRLSRTKNHVVLMQDFIRACGISDEERDAAEPLPETAELINYRMKLVKNPDTFHKGAAAVMVASEGQNLETKAGTARDTLFKDVYGMKDKDLLFFSVHQKEDIGHVQEGYSILADICTTEQMQQEALHVVNETCKRFRGMYTGILNEYQGWQQAS